MDQQFILNIMEKFSALNVAALELTIGDTTICLQKDAAFAPTKVVQHNGAVPLNFAAQPAAPATPAPQPLPAQTAAPASSAAGAETAPSVQGAASETFIKSPIVGTFYRSPSPDSPAYAEEGKTVKKGQPLCILEAMKMMNTLEAEFDCVIEKILASNGDLIEFDQPIFQVRKL